MAMKIDIAETNISASQMSEFYRLAALQGSHVDRVTFQAYLERCNPFAFESVLALVNGNVQFNAVDTHDPQTFFQTRTGLWVSDEFRSWILSKAKPVKKLAAAVGKSYDLTQDAYNREITPWLPKGYALDESGACARIATMIQKQPNGGAGDLLNNGYSNLFYVAGYVVYVIWRAIRREWHIHTWRRGDDRWPVSSRVFSRN